MKVKKAGKICGAFKVSVKYQVRSVFFPIEIFSISLVFKNSLLVQNFISLNFQSLSWREEREFSEFS
jgi:hypothetical protein